jgi:hypothetical protein
MMDSFQDARDLSVRSYAGRLNEALLQERIAQLACQQQEAVWWRYEGPDCAPFAINLCWSDDKVVILDIIGDGVGTGRMRQICDALEEVGSLHQTSIIFDEVTNSGMAHVLRHRGFVEDLADEPTMRLAMPDQRVPHFHVTHRETAQIIMEEGLAGGWGDDGYGVYLFNDLGAACAYRDTGGWDGGEPRDLVIIMVRPAAEDIEDIEINASWPNPEDYEHVVLHRLHDASDDDRWRPAIKMLELAPAVEADMAFA